MKKIILVFTMICAGQLYCMEPEQPYETLSPELKQEIIKNALAISKNLDETVRMIKNLSALHGISYDNIKDFTRLVHILADKFKVGTIHVAQKFNTPTSTQYTNLFIKAANSNFLTIDQMIENGLDVNATFYSPNKSLLIIAVEKKVPLTIIQLLLNAGANPHYKDKKGKSALDYAKAINAEDTILVLEEAMKKTTVK